VTDSAPSRLLSGVRWATWLWCAGLAGCLFVAATPAAADVPTRLVYVRTPEAAACPDQAALQKAVEARLGHDPFSIWGENTVIATVSAHGADLRARAELVDGAGVMRGSRDVFGSTNDCDELILALALAISITLDPMQLPVPAEAKPEGVPPVEPEPEPEAEPEPEPEPEPAEPAPARPLAGGDPGAPRRAPPATWRGYTSLFGSVGALPSPSPGARLGFNFQRGGFRAGVEFGLSAPAPEDLGDGDRVVISLFGGNLYSCLAMSRRIFWCVVGSYGMFRGRGEGVSSPRTDLLSYAAVGTRLAYDLPLGSRWSLAAHTDVLAVLTRPTFTLNGKSAWRPPPISTELGLSLSLRFL
jgi:hypothetical protein